MVTEAKFKMAKKMASVTKKDIKELVYSCLYEEWVERGYPENFEAGKISISLFNKKIDKYFKVPKYE